MDDLISRATVLNAIDNERKILIEQNRLGAEHVVVHHARRLIEDLPAVDAVPVVRCRDCKYAHMTYDGEVKYCDIISMPDADGDYGYALYLPGDWFCADGERREEE